MFISPSVYLTKCFLSKLCSLGQPLPKFAVVRNFVNHCNRAITFQALQSGGRLLFIADQQHTQSLNVRHAATGCFCSGCFGSRLHRLLGCSGCSVAQLLWLLWLPARLLRLHGCTGCSVAQLLWLLWLPARLLRLSACPLWLLAFIPYAKVKKLILTHYILFIWQDRCMFFSDAAFPSSRCCFYLFPMDLPGSSIFATAPRPAALPRRPGQPASLPLRCPSQQHLPYSSSLQRPCQQQTSSGGEEYFGLASNLAHLGRIC